MKWKRGICKVIKRVNPPPKNKISQCAGNTLTYRKIERCLNNILNQWK